MSGPPSRAPSDRPRKQSRRNGPPRAGKPPVAKAQMSTTTGSASQLTAPPVLTPASSLLFDEDTPRFADIAGISPQLLKAIPHERSTPVQAETLPIILAGHDVLAQAKTGTGKTLAFLIPSIQRLLSHQHPGPDKISILVISPTRELAQQIEREAEIVLSKLGRTGGVMSAVGGTNIKSDMRKLSAGRVDVLVATPGRLNDLLQNSDLKRQLGKLTSFILDEADRLLDQGFKPELDRIVAALPDPKTQPRQTLLFSATLPDSVKGVARKAMKPDHKFVSTLRDDEVNTHERVKQELVMVPQEEIFPATLGAIMAEKAKFPSAYKVMVFLPTARSAGLYHEVFAQTGQFDSWAIHSRMSQPARTKTTEAFRSAQTGVLFSSDVTARGIDIKDVTAVIQVGLPSDAEQYIHRLGRTARAGAEGHGVLILTPDEGFFLRNKIIQALTLHPFPAWTPTDMTAWRDTIDRAMDQVSKKTKADAYRAWLGYYKTSAGKMKWSAERLVQEANDWSRTVLRYGNTPPGMEAKTVGKMGLKGVPGLNIEKAPARVQQNAPRGRK